jgi:glucosamine kinase
MADRVVGRELFVGIDGGATKTIARVENAQGQLLGVGKAGPANIRLDPVGAWRSIRAAIAQALAEFEIPSEVAGYRWYGGAGLAGTQVPAACDRFLALGHRFTRLHLHSDGYISCLGAHQGQDGAVIAIGTGVVAYQIEGERVTRVSGWGFPQGDEGSGAWLGLAAIQQTLQWWDGRRAVTPLIRGVMARFDQDGDRLILWANAAGSQQFAELAPVVMTAAAAGDESAIALMTAAGQEIEKIWRALVAKQQQPLPCSLLGGLASPLEPYLGDEMRSHLVPPQADAATGAVLLARQENPGATGSANE